MSVVSSSEMTGLIMRNRLKRHYATGAPDDWQQQHYVSAYATTHPWEDFAETWAHYLHIVDTLEMASEFGLEVHPRRDREGGLAAQIDFDPYEVDFLRANIACLATVRVRDEQREPHHGRPRSLPLRAFAPTFSQSSTLSIGCFRRTRAAAERRRSPLLLRCRCKSNQLLFPCGVPLALGRTQLHNLMVDLVQRSLIQDRASELLVS